MENNKPRVLAYQLAQPIPEHQLEEISGGGASNNQVFTFKITGPHQSFDIDPDFRPDW